MVLSVPLYIAVLLLVSFIPSVRAFQDDIAQSKGETDSFFSGNVVEVAADHVIVSRTILGKTPEKRMFKINESTKVEGKMKQKSRVTIRFATKEDGDTALAILVRSDQKNDSSKKK